MHMSRLETDIAAMLHDTAAVTAAAGYASKVKLLAFYLQENCWCRLWWTCLNVTAK